MMILAVAAAVILIIVFWFIPVRLWIAALASGVPISPTTFIGMRLRKVNPRHLLPPLITIRKAGLKATIQDMERHYLAGGNIGNVIKGLIAADRANIPLSFERARTIDLAGRNVSEAVATSVMPKVIDAPNPGSGKQYFDAVAKDGIQLKVKVRITVRTNIDTLVGGATENTIIARVGEGIVSAIGSSESYKKVLEVPDVISKSVLDRGLDSGTAYEILSIDIADVDVGKNIGAELRINQAVADKEIARAKAEKRRAQAEAEEEEMKALEEEKRADLFKARAEVPKAISEAFRTKKLGIIDYYDMNNIMADTEMRKSIAEGQRNILSEKTKAKRSS